MTDFSDFLASLKSRLASAANTDARNTGVRDLNPSPDSGAGVGVADSKLRIAAVALVLRRRLSEAELLIIKRSVSERDHWSGHLALPGGRAEPEDASLSATAVRETFEEVGINLGAGGAVLGRLATVTPQSRLAPPVSVTPFVAVAPAEYHVLGDGEASKELALSDEVAAAFWVPVSELRTGGRSDKFRMVFAGVEREWPAYPSAHGPIWGLTERILTEFLSLIEE
ncbi:MAG TPA: CoA pyrophosphatase [Pyrinomonadaceae bacterium]|nr:CoA pyrophosphatase [Pyrinomonadaceae bacterium]